MACGTGNSGFEKIGLGFATLLYVRWVVSLFCVRFSSKSAATCGLPPTVKGKDRGVSAAGEEDSLAARTIPLVGTVLVKNAGTFWHN